VRVPAGGVVLRLSTTADCGLAIGRYPRFRYDARGGGGVAELGELEGSGLRPILFAPSNLKIPPLGWRTTRVMGLPLPPGLTIAIAPDELAGNLEPATGNVELRFRARFRFSLAGLYQAPDLHIDTLLCTGPVQGQRHRATGQPMGLDGRAVLVGVATVPPSGDAWLDRFLGLPDEALAMLRCSFAPPL
jgi:hypothetical protein